MNIKQIHINLPFIDLDLEMFVFEFLRAAQLLIDLLQYITRRGIGHGQRFFLFPEKMS